MTRAASRRASTLARVALQSLFAIGCAGAAHAQGEGGLYIAGAGFSFQQAAEQGLAKNPHGQRFFLLALPPNTTALTKSASRSNAALRSRVVAAGGVLLVCQRDIDNGKISPANLVPGVTAVRGFPPPGSGGEPNQRYFPGDDPAKLPASNEALRRLRATCS